MKIIQRAVMASVIGVAGFALSAGPAGASEATDGAAQSVSQARHHCHGGGWWKSRKPVQETPVQEAPVEEVPAEEAPVQEVPVEEAPVDTPVLGGELPGGPILQPLGHSWT